MHVELHAEAILELEEAIDCYDERRPGLGDDFEPEVWRTVERIAAHRVPRDAYPELRRHDTT